MASFAGTYRIEAKEASNEETGGCTATKAYINATNSSLLFFFPFWLVAKNNNLNILPHQVHESFVPFFQQQ